MEKDSTRSTSEDSTSKSSAEQLAILLEEANAELKRMKEEVLERLAALEHEQWAHWTRYMLDNLTLENIKRWRKQIETPYAELSEKEKDSDREYAEKVLAIWKEVLTSG